MEMKPIEWQGYEGVEFTLEDYVCKVIKPKCEPNGKWVLKTHYFTAFPQTECELLSRGWHVAFQTNRTSWATEDDVERKARFVKFVSETFSLAPICSTVGMSCGGLYAVRLAVSHPELIDVLYIDAPVLNFLSCPANLGAAAESTIYEGFLAATGITKSQLLSYRENPIDKMHVLLENDIPVVMVSGDADTVVPYAENGAILEKYYKKNGGRIWVAIKPEGDHHPHGLVGYEGLVADMIELYSRQNQEKKQNAQNA